MYNSKERKLAAYALKDIAINPSFSWLYILFLANGTFSSLPFLSEWVNDARSVAEMHTN